MQMIQCMETVPSWFTASWKDSLTFLLSPTQVGDPEQQPLPWEITSACSREAGIRDRDKFLHGNGWESPALEGFNFNCVDGHLGPWAGWAMLGLRVLEAFSSLEILVVFAEVAIPCLSSLVLLRV